MLGTLASQTKEICPLWEDQPVVVEEGAPAIQVRQVNVSRAEWAYQNGLMMFDFLMLSVSGPATALVHEICGCGVVEAGNGRGTYLQSC